MHGIGRERRTVYDALLFRYGSVVDVADDVPEDRCVVGEYVAVEFDVVASIMAASERGVFELLQT